MGTKAPARQERQSKITLKSKGIKLEKKEKKEAGKTKPEIQFPAQGPKARPSTQTKQEQNERSKEQEPHCQKTIAG